MSGTILISVNLSEVPDVYGPTPRNTAVTFPAASIYTAVAQSSGLGLASIQLLELPATNEGVIYVGGGTSKRADTETLYGYSSGAERISQRGSCRPAASPDLWKSPMWPATARRSHCQRQALPGHCQRYGGLL